MQQENIVLKTRDVVVLACVGGVCVGFGAFAIFHYITSTNKKQQHRNRSRRNSDSSSIIEPIINDRNSNNNTDKNNIELSPPKQKRLSFTNIDNHTMARTSTVSPNLGAMFTSPIPRISRLHRHYSDQRLYTENDTTTDELIDDLKELDSEDQIKALREQNYQLQNLLQVARQTKYDVSNPNHLSASDIETIRSIFDATDADQDGCITDQELIDIYQRLGEPLTTKEAHDILKELDPTKSNAITFDTFLSWWHVQHKGGKKNKSYAQKFKFICAGLKKSDFDVNKIIIKAIGQRNTTEFRYSFHYEQKNGKLKQISPWHDIPLHHFKHQNIFNFVCKKI